MFTIVALGNPGAEYETTRHNAGQFVMNKLVSKWNWGRPFDSAKLGGKVFEGNIDNQPVRLVFPDTYMNHSGTTAKKLLTEAKLSELVVVYDEVDLPFGTCKLSYSRGAGGHNGLASVIQSVGSPDFLRIRIGIAPTNWLGRMVRPQGDKLADYVLGLLTRREEAKLVTVVPTVETALETFVKSGYSAAMNVCN